VGGVNSARRAAGLQILTTTVARSGWALAPLLALALLGASTSAAPAPTAPGKATADKPSRPADDGCKWERFSDPSLPLDAWVQRCHFGDRKVDVVVVDHSLAERFSDLKSAPVKMIDVFDLQPGETPEQGIRRLFAEQTDKKLAAQCVLAPYHESGKVPAGVKRYSFVPNATLAKALKAKADPNDVPDPACGDFGDQPDAIEYWETQPANSRTRVMYVRVGQDQPLFDEATLRLR
jgi:hypothetical protein